MTIAGPDRIIVFDRAAQRAKRDPRHLSSAPTSSRRGRGAPCRPAGGHRSALSRRLDLGCRDGVLGASSRAGAASNVSFRPTPHRVSPPQPAGARLAAEPEFLPFKPASLDAVLSVLLLHWANDLPGALLQLRRALKPDGLLLVSLLRRRDASASCASA